MSQYNKTVLTSAGLELAKRANAGQAKFEITRAVTSADDWSNKTIQDIEAVTAIPNIMQQGTIRDTEEVENNNSVMGVSLCFTNKNLSAGYQIKIIGVYVKEEGQENDFLYAVTTAVSPEYMPDFSNEVLYRFNMQLYLVIGKTQAVNVVINDGASVTHGQFDKYKSEVTADLEKIENTHKEDMSHVVKSASINGGDEILPNETGKLELVVPDPDLSKYVSLEQLTETLKSKADITAIPDKTATEEGIKQAKEMAQEADTKAQNALDNKADKTTIEENLATKANQSDLNQTNAEVAKKANKADTYTKSNIDDMQAKSYFRKQGMDQNGNAVEIRANAVKQTDGGYAFDIWNTDWTASKLKGVLDQLPSKANSSDVSTDISNLQSQINSKTSGTIVTAYDIANKTPTKETNSYTNKWLVDQNVLGQFADQINQLKGRRAADAPDFNKLTDSGVYHITNPNKGKDNPPTLIWGILTVLNGGYGQRITQTYIDDNSDTFVRAYGWSNTANANVWSRWNLIAWKSDITDLQNQIQQLKDNQFEVQTFTDATAAANWEAQRPGKRMAIVNS